MRRCYTCRNPLPSRTHGELVKLLSQLHGELTMRPVPPNVSADNADSYRVGRASELIAAVLAEETAGFCSRHGGSTR